MRSISGWATDRQPHFLIDFLCHDSVCDAVCDATRHFLYIYISLMHAFLSFFPNAASTHSRIMRILLSLFCLLALLSALIFQAMHIECTALYMPKHSDNLLYSRINSRFFAFAHETQALTREEIVYYIGKSCRSAHTAYTFSLHHSLIVAVDAQRTKKERKRGCCSLFACSNERWRYILCCAHQSVDNEFN